MRKGRPEIYFGVKGGAEIILRHYGALCLALLCVNYPICLLLAKLAWLTFTRAV